MLLDFKQVRMEGGHHSSGKKSSHSLVSSGEVADRKKRKREVSSEASSGVEADKAAIGQKFDSNLGSDVKRPRKEPRHDVASITDAVPSATNAHRPPQDETSRFILHQAEMRIREQNLASERDIAERLAGARSTMSLVRPGRSDSLGSRSDSHNETGLASSYSRFSAPSVMTREYLPMSSLLLLEQQNQELLRHQGFLNASGILNRLYPGVHSGLLSQTIGATASSFGGLPSDLGAFAAIHPQTATSVSLSSLANLRALERSRLLAVQDILRDQRQNPTDFLSSSLLARSTSDVAGPMSGMTSRTISESVASEISGAAHGRNASDLSWKSPKIHSTSSALARGLTSTTSQPTGNALIFQPGSGVSLLECLPVPIEGDTFYRVPHFSQRFIVPLASDEDQNWLSEMLCFVRSDIVEIFRAQEMDIRSRNSSKRIRLGQIGIRCRYCAHIPKGARAGRSASFPSSLDRIYQSLTMMLRDHFGRCTGMPLPIQNKFLRFKRKTTQGATDSKLFWVLSAQRMGLVDSEEGGIWIKGDINASNNDDGIDAAGDRISVAAGSSRSRLTTSTPYDPQAFTATANETEVPPNTPSAGSSVPRRRSSESSSSSSSSSRISSAAALQDHESSKRHAASTDKHVAVEGAREVCSLASTPRTEGAVTPREPVRLLFPEDREIITPFLFALLSQVDIVYLERNERVGNRKSLPVGLPGLCCRHCARSGRKGMCRVFPARRRNLPAKVYDLYDHFMKCNLCPASIQQELRNLKQLETSTKTKREERGFFAELWARMGHHGR
jgi:hypothetical protein